MCGSGAPPVSVCVNRSVSRNFLCIRAPTCRKATSAIMFSPVSALRLESSVRLQAMVADLAYRIARKMNLPDDQVETIYAAGRLHDIGELSLPAAMLMKQSRLTKPEYMRVRDHCRVGYDMIRDVSCPWPIGEVVLQHHERLDGSGYPEGLKGSEISIATRVVAVADVVVAICSDRPHKKARSIEFALGELERGRTTLYDGDVVDACNDLFVQDGLGWPLGEQPQPPVFSEWVNQL